MCLGPPSFQTSLHRKSLAYQAFVEAPQLLSNRGEITVLYHSPFLNKSQPLWYGTGVSASSQNLRKLETSVGGLVHPRIATRQTRSLLCTKGVLEPRVDGDPRRGIFISTMGRISASRLVAPSCTSELEFIQNCIILDGTRFFESIP